jgi:hypothetical protein
VSETVEYGRSVGSEANNPQVCPIVRPIMTVTLTLWDGLISA